MNVKNSVYAICVEAIIYLLLHNLHEWTFSSDIPTHTPIMCNYTRAPGSIERRFRYQV